MPQPILDFHTHGQNVYGTCCVHPRWRPFLRNGLVRLYEKTRFNPLMKRLESPRSHSLVIREMQSRFATFTWSDYLSGLRRAGVTHACALPVEPMARTSDLLHATRGHAHVLPFASIDLGDTDPVGQLRRHLDAGCCGLKLHPIMQCFTPASDERIQALFEALRGREIPVLFHTGRVHYYLDGRAENPEGGDPGGLVPLLRRFPAQPVVLGHMGMLDAAGAIAIAEAHPQVYLETSFQPVKVVREALRRIGPDRILLGSDFPATDPRTEIRIARKAVDGDRIAERKILFENAATLLGRSGTVV